MRRAATLDPRDPERGGVVRLGDALRGLLRASGLDERLAEQEVLAAWRAAVGPRLEERARALRFSRGELLVEVASAAHLTELKSFTGEGYRRAANRRLGTERIRRVSYQPKR